MEAKDYIQRLNELSLKKLSLLQELLLFTRSQKEIITAGRFEEMDSLIAEKQRRMDAVDKLDEQFLVYSSRLKSALAISSLEELPGFNIPGTSELKACISKIHGVLSEMKTLEDENASQVKKELKETKEKINHSNAFKRVAGAYNPVNSDIPSYYFDKKK
jgi:hypothetical protein